jgi:hypothetical protein
MRSPITVPRNQSRDDRETLARLSFPIPEGPAHLVSEAISRPEALPRLLPSSAGAKGITRQELTVRSVRSCAIVAQEFVHVLGNPASSFPTHHLSFLGILKWTHRHAGPEAAVRQRNRVQGLSQLAPQYGGDMRRLRFVDQVSGSVLKVSTNDGVVEVT